MNILKKALCRRNAENFRKQVLRVSKLSTAIFVKIGANDGVINDPCSDILLANTNWKGVLVEPVPFCCERLKKNFSDTSRFVIKQIAVGAAAGRLPFYYIDQSAISSLPSLPEWWDQIGSFSREHILKHFGAKIEPFIVESKVETLTLSDIFSSCGLREIHLLHIDTEGYDFEILKTLDFAKYCPLIIYIEHKHLSGADKKEMIRLLCRNGYSVRNCGEDYYASNKILNNKVSHGAEINRGMA
jgi:FkbM family methyltransferase